MACVRRGPRRRERAIRPAAEPTARARILAAGCLLAASGILLGAFGAHALRGVLGAAELGWWQTGVQYQMWQAVGLVALAGLGERRMALPATLLAAGTPIFSGSLYAMALGGPHWLGAATPLGGLLMIAGWLLAGWRGWHRN